ncbi:hypothetical protein [Streptacidiphilus carbonis]|uniref:hypothetical protein n=1 Tax=Streptacidiphilus carbonis TaxID=105422 RepID=UPI0005A60A20|nr:hypothetical protein [Streptacidiphilus carbonis]
MNRRRTAAAVLALCAAGALTACSSGPAHPGAAAVIGNDRITVATLQSHVSAFRAAAAGDTAAQQQAGVSQKTLGLLVADQLVDQTLAKDGKSVTEGQVQQVEAAYLQQAGSAQALRQAVVDNLLLAPSDLELYAHLQAGQVLLLQQAGVDPSSSSADAALKQIISKASSEIGVTVNPRYGSWDARTLTLAAANQPWLRTASSATA